MDAVKEVLDSGWYILGRKVEEFERQYARFNGVKFCAGISNGLDALQLALKALDIGEGDEVILPSNTYIATVIAVSNVGARPVFVEPLKTTCNIDPALIKEKITGHSKAIIPVHLFGQACEMSAIMSVAENSRLYVIEDNAQAHGATNFGKLTGSFGHINATSFYPTKNLGALGDAGAITTDSEGLLTAIKKLRNYGFEKKYYSDIIGNNARLDELQAAILLTRLDKLQQRNKQRVKIAEHYSSLLFGIEGIILPEVAINSTSVFHIYLIRTEKRDELKKYLASRNVETMIHYPVPPHLQKAYSYLGYKRGEFPIAETIAETCLSLPMYPNLSSVSVEYVCEQINGFFHG
ncbi:MAG: DegT/DnrJ/EryC1/StrS family aminotransferase [Chitinophagales bacterium]|nr:DegT/DnrJ/EryC1/StrS family aminotransferase [Chitinophagales bacterium]